MANSFKKYQIKSDLLTDIDFLLMVEKSIREGICHVLHWYVNANEKYIKDYDENKETSYLKYWDVNNLYRSQKLPVNAFKSVENTSEFDENFIKSEIVIKGIFLRLMFNILKNYMGYIMIYHFYSKNENWESWKTYS